ncbi:MAG: arginase family protein [Candidatus Limnocylindria bacterium]
MAALAHRPSADRPVARGGRPVVIAGSPTALGGHFAGMERTPGELRRLGLPAVLAERPGLRDVAWTDAGDAPNEPGWAPDPDPRAKNRAAIAAYLGRLADHVATALADGRDDAAGPDGGLPPALLVLGGDCTSHAGAVAGLRRALPGEPRIGLVWFDAHGDFNTPATTPSGNVWGMPFALLVGRGDADLLAPIDAPLIREEDAALAGGQVLDEPESRALAASRIAHFGAGMLGTDAGRAALGAWAAAVAARIDGWYVAFDLDAIDAAEDLALAMPEAGGLALDDAIRAVAVIAATGPVLGFGATAAMFGRGGGEAVTVEAIARLVEAALGRPAALGRAAALPSPMPSPTPSR